MEAVSIKQTVRGIFEEKWVRIYLGFGLAAVLPPVFVAFALMCFDPFTGLQLPTDGPMFMTIVTLGLMTSLPPTILIGVPLYLIRRRLGALGLPAALLMAPIGGLLTMRVLIPDGGYKWHDYVFAMSLGVPSAIVLWWFALRLGHRRPAT